ncbi:MAG: ATPase [Candidatus Scalindua sp.]|nr:ATP-binding protein [Planctomycetota bacterium]GJQ59219.1 MAG: ATPase [Candidatus Scalindua sp.]
MSSSAFLLGPRGTGKSTWIKHHFPNAITYDLLNTAEVIRFSRQPSLLYDETIHLPPKTTVVIDEIQKVPDLLNEVHRIIEDRNLFFILSGSSARKLRRSSVNLLAGRAITFYLFPFVSKEVGFDFDLKKQITYGMLPLSFLSEKPMRFLKTYAETYLKEEIKGEALTRNIGNFARFLEVAARQNGQITNVSSISRDAMVARQTVQGYFEILIDTLTGFWLYPWKLKTSTKQVAHPKFYFFDSGVVRALSGRLAYPILHEELGPLFETFIINELRAYLHYNDNEYPLYYWRSHGGNEVDIFLEQANEFLAIEIKSVKVWERKYNRGLHRLREELGEGKVKCLGIFLGERVTKMDGIYIYPAMEFLRLLWKNQIII